MSKTYRSSMLRLDCNCGAPLEKKFSWNKGVITESVEINLHWANSRGVPPDRECECKWIYDYYSKRNYKRDRKNPWKANKAFKQVSKRHFRAKVRHEMNNHRYETMPVKKNTDTWDWN